MAAPNGLADFDQGGLQGCEALARRCDPAQFEIFASETGERLQHRLFHLAEPFRPRNGIDDAQPTHDRSRSQDERRASVGAKVPDARDERIALGPRIICEIDDL